MLLPHWEMAHLVGHPISPSFTFLGRFSHISPSFQCMFSFLRGGGGAYCGMWAGIFSRMARPYTQYGLHMHRRTVMMRMLWVTKRMGVRFVAPSLTLRGNVSAPGACRARAGHLL